jgi:Zn-finger nucleic acid-binding protein
MHCEHCGAAMRADPDRGLFICDYCSSEFAPPPEADGVLVMGPSALRCSLCKTPLDDGLLESFALKYCPTCHGMLLAMEDLPPLIDALRRHRDRPSGYFEARSPADADRHLPCPQCSSSMDGHAYGGGGNVNVDSCETCSLVWLDRGELHKIAVAPDHQPVYSSYEDGDEHDCK